MFRICIIIFVGITLSCEERIRDNPFDKYNTLSPLEWRPFNLEAQRKSINEAILTWEYGDFNIEGFKIFRKTNEGASVELSSIGEERRLYNDSTVIGSDTLTYYYRMYAFAGSNLSGSIEKELVEARPQTVDVLSVTYDLEKMTVTWEKSPDQDFESYELLYSLTESGEKSTVITIGNVDALSYFTQQFDPTKENWYWIKVINNFGFSIIGKGKTNTIDSPPIQSELYPIELKDDSLHLTWSKNNESDFKSYTVYESTYEDMSGKTEIAKSTDTTYVRSIENNQIKYYQIQVEDVWGLQSISNTQEGNPYIRFVKTFDKGSNDFGFSVQQTSDDGYIISGNTESGDNGILLIKTDANGEEEWNRTFVDFDGGYTVKQTTDGGFIIIGRYAGDVGLIKTDSNGDEEWNKKFGKIKSDIGYSVQQTTDGGYIITGLTQDIFDLDNDIYLIKTSPNGNSEWSKTFGGSWSDSGYSVQQTTDGGYIITGYVIPGGNSNIDVGLIKTDSQGNEEWNKTFGGSNDEMGFSVQQTTDGGYIITGYTISFGNGQEDLVLIKADSNGDEEWVKTFGGSETDFGLSVQQTTDGGYIITGYTNSIGNGDRDFWLIKTDLQGNEEWNKTFGGTGSEEAQSVEQTTDGGYIITGYTHSFRSNQDVLLIKTDPNGNTVDY